VLVGASDQAVRAVGLANLPDEDPGSGPLGGLATALSWVAAENERTGSPGHGSAVRHGAEGSDAVDPLAILLVAACDQPDLDAVALRLLIDALASEDRAMAAAACFSTDDGRRHPLPSAWRLDLTAGPVGRLHAGGERRIGAAFDAVATVELPTGGDELIDLDTPSDVALWQERHRPLG
jgi:molybdopterin-guanine dinucleotide biosynthesis protein A